MQIIISIFAFILLSIALDAQTPTGEESTSLVDLATKSGYTHYSKDSFYTHTVTIDSIIVKITCVNRVDSVELSIDIMNDKLNPIWIGVTSVNTFFGGKEVSTVILPDLNLHEPIELVNIDNEHRLPIWKDRFDALNNYSFTFYLINNWDKFIQCVNEKSDIVTYENDLGQTVLQIRHARMPENGFSIISLSKISSTKNYFEFSYEVIDF